ncbi:unnamed protein product [Lymnaea stagnalis]|uniref:Transmembrane protein 179 n=1 Tax=Lymnaea stagnalis TaxID=6523 RepID=A0AAV2HVU1_LYMST
MAIPHKFLLAQACLYLLLFILSFFVCVPAGVNVSDFNGHCLLYSSGKWNTTSPSSVTLQEVDWGPNSACNFTVFIGVISLITSLLYLVWTSVLLVKSIESSWCDAFINLMVNSIICVCIFSTAMSVSVGFRDWCQLITNPVSGIQRCEEGQYLHFDDGIGINPENFYTQWQMAQFGIWSCWLTWLALSVMSVVRLYQYHRQESFSQSMNRERQRLLARVGKSSEPA